ncbi:MAG: sensor histidine kinase, partial [Acidimicrobiia bacterium]
AVQLKNEFVSMVSHELRTPITSIIGFASTLRDSWRDLERDEVEEFLGIMLHESVHLKNLVEDILVIPRLEAGRLPLDNTDFELRPAAFRISDLLFPQGGPKQAGVNIPGSVVVHADPNRVQQVLRNLLENAHKYGGDQVLIDGEPLGAMYQVSVSDNGPGVPEADRERIFEHFEQGSKGDSRTDTGIGLGLPIARKLVRVMGGDLWCEQRFPTGARFCFTIKLVSAEESEADQSERQAALPSS